MKSLKILIGTTLLMSIFSCEIDELPNEEIVSEELLINQLSDEEQSLVPQISIGEDPLYDTPPPSVGDQHDKVEDRNGL